MRLPHHWNLSRGKHLFVGDISNYILVFAHTCERNTSTRSGLYGPNLVIYLDLHVIRKYHLMEKNFNQVFLARVMCEYISLFIYIFLSGWIQSRVSAHPMSKDWHDGPTFGIIIRSSLSIENFPWRHLLALFTVTQISGTY